MPPCYSLALAIKSLLTHLSVSILAALGTATACKVACRLLHENDTALSALNLYWRVGVDILDFRIVKLLPMHPLCFLDKLRCRFPMVGHFKYYCLLNTNVPNDSDFSVSVLALWSNFSFCSPNASYKIVTLLPDLFQVKVDGLPPWMLKKPVLSDLNT